MDPILHKLLDVLEERLAWIERCLASLPQEAIWRRPRAEMNSIGNLCLHLAGNESHYLGRGVGGLAYERDRAEEFNATEGDAADALIAKLHAARALTKATLANLSATDFENPVNIDYPPNPTVFDVIVHVVEHYSYHTGQIVQLARWLKGDEGRLLDWGH